MRYGLINSRIIGVLAAVVAVVMAVGPVVSVDASTARPPAAAARAVAAAVPPVAGAVVSVTPARIADSRSGLQISGWVSPLAVAPVQVTGLGGARVAGWPRCW